MIRTTPEDGDLPCVLVPQHGPWSLLLPNVCVAEILRGGTPEPREDAPSWLAGDLQWRQLRIPVVNFDALGDLGGDASPARSIVVLNRSRPLAGLPFYAVTAAATPRLLRITAEDVHAARMDVPFDAAFGQAVNVLGEEALVPHLEALEDLLRDFVVH